MTTPDMTTQPTGQPGPATGPLASLEDARAAALSALAGEGAVGVPVVACQLLSLAQYRANELSMNRLAAAPVQTTGRRAYWRGLGRTLYWRLSDLSGGRVRPEATVLAPVRVVVWFGFEDGRTGPRDGVNCSPMVKAIVDGLVDAGLAVDDSALLVPGQDARRLPGRSPVGRVWVVVTVVGGRPGVV